MIGLVSKQPTVIREMGGSERRILDKLLSVEFPGRDELRVQAATALVSPIGADGVPAFVFKIDDEAPLAAVRGRIPVEALSNAIPGKVVHCLLHVVDGRLSELEFFREDGTQIKKLPNADDLIVSANR